MRLTFALTCLAFVFSSSPLWAQQTSTPSATITPGANMCTERGLKCCNKARGKRAEKIRLKCEKKYKCQCPAPVAKQ